MLYGYAAVCFKVYALPICEHLENPRILVASLFSRNSDAPLVGQRGRFLQANLHFINNILDARKLVRRQAHPDTRNSSQATSPTYLSPGPPRCQHPYGSSTLDPACPHPRQLHLQPRRKLIVSANWFFIQPQDATNVGNYKPEESTFFAETPFTCCGACLDDYLLKNMRKDSKAVTCRRGTMGQSNYPSQHVHSSTRPMKKTINRDSTNRQYLQLACKKYSVANIAMHGEQFIAAHTGQLVAETPKKPVYQVCSATDEAFFSQDLPPPPTQHTADMRAFTGLVVGR